MRSLRDYLALFVRGSTLTRHAFQAKKTNLQQAISLNELAVDRLNDGHIGEAKKILRQALEHDPELAPAICNLGIILASEGSLAAAVDRFNLALFLDPKLANARLNLGLALKELEQYDEATKHLSSLLESNPDLVGTYNALAGIARERGDPYHARTLVTHGLSLAPNDPDLHCLSGLILYDMGNYEPAAEAYRKALSLDPNHAEAELGLAFIDLLAGDFKDGWVKYEARRHAIQSTERGFRFPEWDGSPLANKTILIYGEQGLGDEIMFASCYGQVIAQASNCVIDCEPRLAALFARSFPSARIYGTPHNVRPDWLEAEPNIHCQIPAGSLPSYFRNQLADFPFHTGYLKPAQDKVAKWKARLNDLGPGLKIGISWRGGLGKTRRTIRTMPPSAWLPILRTPHAQFVSLQYDEMRGECSQLTDLAAVPIQHWPQAIADYDETAALVGALDLVITVCTAVAHLSGALGRPTWVLVPSAPEWRYLKADEQMPWYPAAQLFRQSVRDDWEEVSQQVAEKLAQRIDNND